MEWTAALTLAFAGIGALGTVYTVVDGFTKRRAERQARAEAEAREWSLSAEQSGEAGHWTLTFRYEAALRRPVAIREIALIDPQGGDLSRSTAKTCDWRSSIRMDRDLDPGFARVGKIGLSALPYAAYEFRGRVPAALLSRDGRTRFRISLTIEDRSALRRQSSFIVASQEIAWTASSADKAT